MIRSIRARGKVAEARRRWIGLTSPFGPRWFELLRDGLNSQSVEILESRLEPVSIGNVA